MSPDKETVWSCRPRSYAGRLLSAGTMSYRALQEAGLHARRAPGAGQLTAFLGTLGLGQKRRRACIQEQIAHTEIASEVVGFSPCLFVACRTHDLLTAPPA